MPIGLTGPEWSVLVVAIGPLVLAIVVVVIFWRWSVRSEREETMRAPPSEPPSDDPDP